MQFTPAERCFNLFFKKIAILYKPIPYCKNNEHLHMLPQNTNGVCTRIPTRKKNYLEQNNCFPFLAFDAQVSLCCTAKDNLNLQQSLQKTTGFRGEREREKERITALMRVVSFPVFRLASERWLQSWPHNWPDSGYRRRARTSI